MAWLNNDAELLFRWAEAVNHQQLHRSNMTAEGPQVAAINGPHIIAPNNIVATQLCHQNMVRQHQKRVKELNRRHQQQILPNNFPQHDAIDPRVVQLQHQLLVNQLAKQAHHQNAQGKLNVFPNGHQQLLAQNQLQHQFLVNQLAEQAHRQQQHQRGHMSNGLAAGASSTSASPVGSFNNSGQQTTNGVTNLTGNTTGAANGSVIVADKCYVSVNNFQGSN